MTDDRSEPVPVLDEALEAARRIVADAPCDEDMMRARANLCAFSGYDEDGIQATYRSFIVARALLALSARVEEWRPIGDELRERLKLGYAGDCRCGKCQLVPADLIHRILSAIPLPSPPIEKG